MLYTCYQNRQATTVAFLGKRRFGPGNASGVQRKLESQKARHALVHFFWCALLFFAFLPPA